jgi:hypothetical protein
MRVPDTDSIQSPQPRPVTPVFQNPNAADGAFGQQEAKGLQQTGAQLEDASNQLAIVAQRVQTRQDVVARAKDLTSYHQAINDEARRVSTEEDISDPETVKNFVKFTTDKMDATLAAHRGSPTSRDLLVPSLESTRSSALDTVSAQSLVAQKAVIDNHLDDELAKNVSAVLESPGTLSERLKAWQGVVAEMSPGLGTAKAAEWQRKGDEEVTRSVVQSFIEKGQFDDAEHVLKTPGLDAVMGGKVQRSLNAKLISGRAAFYKIQHEGVLKVNSAEEALGRPLTGPEKLRALGLAPPQGTRTLADEISDAETVLGKPITDEQRQNIVQKKLGLDGSNSPFSDKDSGVMAGLLDKVADGSASQQEKAQFQIAATNYTQQRFDPISGQALPGKVLPAPFQDALDKSGIKLSTDPNRVTPASRDADPRTADDSVSMDIFGNAKNLAGPIPTAARTAAGVPVVGALVPSPQMVQIRTQAELMQRSLATILQDNPRIRGTNSATERQSINDQLNIAGGAMQSGQNFENHLVGVDRFLQQQLQQAQGILNKGPSGSSREEYMWARRAVDAISNARYHLNVPPTVKTTEYAKWSAENPGKPFVGENGQIYTAPGKAQ